MPDETLIAPELVVYRRREIGADQQGQIAEDITRVFDRLETLVRHASRATAIARELDHPVYDCFYLAASEAFDVPLVTADGRLLARATGTPFAPRTIALQNYTPRN